MTGDVAVPHASWPLAAATAAPSSLSLGTETSDRSGAIVQFMTQMTPTRARITGVGFFDEVHGQTGVSQVNGIELHPILKIEWL